MSEFPALDRLEKLATEMAERSRSLEAMTEQLSGIEVTVEEADGGVRVIAGEGGHVSRVELDPRAMRMSSEQLADALTRACKRAVQEYEEQVMELMAPMMGQGEVGNLLRKTVAEHKEKTAAEPTPPAAAPSQWGQPATPPPPSKPLWGDDDDNQWGPQG